jgi:NAD(P)-dependent dehydrogenase (short-subunit alcohol dehydrogenase family)
VADAADPDAVRAAITRTVETLGGPDIMVDNAGHNRVAFARAGTLQYPGHPIQQPRRMVSTFFSGIQSFPAGHGRISAYYCVHSNGS